MSKARRTTIVKAVIQSIHSYAMAAFKLPVTFCMSLDKMSRRFWWSENSGQGYYLALRSWDRLCRFKGCGGFEYRRFEDTTLAFIAKLIWKVASITKDLWVKVWTKKLLRLSIFL